MWFEAVLLCHVHGLHLTVLETLRGRSLSGIKVIHPMTSGERSSAAKSSPLLEEEEELPLGPRDIQQETDDFDTGRG